ncbi:MAG TPA: hypothetical protein PLQ54_06750, partial [Armatimonadota bacterium]|nr:hypothetical protein [Armatimonadota bacterium]
MPLPEGFEERLNRFATGKGRLVPPGTASRVCDHTARARHGLPAHSPALGRAEEQGIGSVRWPATV